MAIVMKNTFKVSITAIVLLTLQVSLTPPAISQMCGDESQPIIIYRNAGPPIIFESAYNPCKEAAKKARKLQRQREKLAEPLANREAKSEQTISDVRP